MAQLPHILSAIRAEHRWLQEVIERESISLVVSDNRYGLWSSLAPCVLVTHQLQIATPFRWLTWLVQQLHYRLIQRFRCCWVPDVEGPVNMAGTLSHPARLPGIPVWYTGALARLRLLPPAVQYQWLMLVSGPEPQRTLLENKLLQLAGQLQGQILLVRGKPGGTGQVPAPDNCTVVNHLDTAAMERAFAASEYIVGRSGYTTVMELLSLQKKALLIPTPGQTEQEYLAGHLMQQHWCYACTQEQLSANSFLQAAQFPYRLPRWNHPTHLEQLILQSLSTFTAGE